MNTWKPIITMVHTGFDKEICNFKKQTELRKNYNPGQNISDKL